MSLPRLEWTSLSGKALCTDPEQQAQWDKLNADRCDIPFLTASAVTAALRTFGDGSERLLLARERGECVAMVLVDSVGSVRWQTFQPSQLPLGAWVAQRRIALAPLAQSLIQSGVLPWCLSLSFTQVDEHLAPMESDSPANRHDPYIETAWVDVEGGYDDYWAQRGKNLRQNMKKQRNKLQAEGVGAAMRVVTDASAIPEAIARYGDLESGGWKAKQGTAVGADDAQGIFYAEMLRSAAAKGQAFVFEYLFDDKVVASNLCMQRGRTLVILKTSYDESISSFSPAFLLHQDLLQYLFEQRRVDRVEYYGRVMEWHLRWTSNVRKLYHLTTFRHSLIKRLVAARATSPAVKAASSGIEA